MPEPYQYGVTIDRGQTIDVQPRKKDAVEVARAWVTSPLRTGPRIASVMRRRGHTGPWEIVDTWAQGFGQQEES